MCLPNEILEVGCLYTFQSTKVASLLLRLAPVLVFAGARKCENHGIAAAPWPSLTESKQPPESSGDAAHLSQPHQNISRCPLAFPRTAGSGWRSTLHTIDPFQPICLSEPLTRLPNLPEKFQNLTSLTTGCFLNLDCR